MNQGGITANQALAQFPIMDEVLVHLFRSLLLLADKADSFDSYVDRETLF